MENDFLLKRPHRRLQLLRSGCKDRSNCYVDPALVSQMLYLEVVGHPHCSCGDKETAAVRGVTRREVDLFFSLINDLPQARRCIGELAWAIGVRFRLPTQAEQWLMESSGAGNGRGRDVVPLDDMDRRSAETGKVDALGLFGVCGQLRQHVLSPGGGDTCYLGGGSSINDGPDVWTCSRNERLPDVGFRIVLGVPEVAS